MSLTLKPFDYLSLTQLMLHKFNSEVICFMGNWIRTN